MVELGPLDLQIRWHIYNHFAEHRLPPTVQETAAAFHRSVEEVAAAYTRLNEAHAIFLQPGTDEIRMANPFSAVPTPFRVHIGERWWWANCGWDALGIAAALHADAHIETHCAESKLPIKLMVEGGQVKGDEAVMHFALPFRRWYDDLVFT